MQVLDVTATSHELESTTHQITRQQNDRCNSSYRPRKVLVTFTILHRGKFIERTAYCERVDYVNLSKYRLLGGTTSAVISPRKAIIQSIVRQNTRITNNSYRTAW